MLELGSKAMIILTETFGIVTDIQGNQIDGYSYELDSSAFYPEGDLLPVEEGITEEEAKEFLGTDKEFYAVIYKDGYTSPVVLRKDNFSEYSTYTKSYRRGIANAKKTIPLDKIIFNQAIAIEIFKDKI